MIDDAAHAPSVLQRSRLGCPRRRAFAVAFRAGLAWWEHEANAEKTEQPCAVHRQGHKGGYSMASIFARCPGVLASGESHVIIVASSASAKATYMAS